MRNPLFMDQSAVVVLSDGIPDVDFFSGDAIRVIPNTEGSQVEAGMSRAVTTFSSDQSGTLELDFMATSVSLDRYEALWTAQTTGFGRLFNVQLMTSSRQPIRCEGCSIGSPGTRATGAKAASAQTVTINVERIIYQ